VVKQVKGVLIEFCSLNKIIQRSVKPGTYSLFVADYGLYPPYLHTTGRNVAVGSCTVIKTFLRNLHDTKILLGDMIKAMIYLNFQYNKGLLYIDHIQELQALMSTFSDEEQLTSSALHSSVITECF
jgi:hypothetical protein